MKNLFLVLFLLVFVSAYSVDLSPKEYSKGSSVDTLDTPIKLEEFWQELQKAETLLVQTSRRLNRERAGKIFQNVTLDRPNLILLLRMTFGINNERFNVDDYHLRYPYSSKRLIQKRLDVLVESGHVNEINFSSDFTITDKGRNLADHYMRETGNMIQALNLDEFTDAEVNTILEMDHKILDALVSSDGEHNSPILKNRLGGLQPDYNKARLWHHWQIIWSILAALEDEQEYLRKSKQIDPFVWYIRRNLWFISRRPWLGGPQTIQDFINHFTSYAPVENMEEKLEKAVRAMTSVGWLEINDGKLQLTEEGLNEHDEDEKQIMESFLDRWPDISQQEIEHVHNLVLKLNNYLEAL